MPLAQHPPSSQAVWVSRSHRSSFDVDDAGAIEVGVGTHSSFLPHVAPYPQHHPASDSDGDLFPHKNELVWGHWRAQQPTSPDGNGDGVGDREKNGAHWYWSG